MNAPDRVFAPAQDEAGPDPVFAAPFDRLDDAALLAHFQGPRPVQVVPVADADGCEPGKIEALLHGRFVFNGEAHVLPDPIDWLHNPSRDIEWHILLHKAYYAVGLGLAFERSGNAAWLRRWVQLLDGWMADVPPGFIAADVTGRRVQNWIYSLHFFVTHPAHDTRGLLPPAFLRRLLQSLALQVEHLCAHLTPKRNHRTLELYAIFLAGVALPEMARAAHWRAFALEQTVANLQADVLADGVHCELSTDYHHLVLKNALNVRRLATSNGVPVPAAFDDVLHRALDFSVHVHQPSGRVPSFSDGDARDHRDILRLAAELLGRDDCRWVASSGREGRAPQRRIAHFDASGYVVVRSHWGDDGRPYADAAHLVMDCGPVGEGNHGHFDCLSIELAAQGRPLIVDPGRYTYSEAPDPADGRNWRVHFRGTAAHNTVCVDGQQQTRYLPKAIPAGTRHAAGSVRHKIAGPAPDARWIERQHGQGLDLLHGEARSHVYDATHERLVLALDDGAGPWIVQDRLRAPTRHRYRLNFQLAAAAQGASSARREGSGTRIASPGLLMWTGMDGPHATLLTESWVSERYGFKERAPAVQSTAEADDAEFFTVLLPHAGSAPAMAVTLLEVHAGDREAGSAGPPPRALRIAHTLAGEPVVDHWFHGGEGTARAWRIGAFACEARWVWWRTTSDGRLLRAVSHAGAVLPAAATRRGEGARA